MKKVDRTQMIKMRVLLLFIALLGSLFVSTNAFCPSRSANRGLMTRRVSDKDEEIVDKIDLAKAMRNARENEKKGMSPGANLDAFEAADAAYADLINTTMDTYNLDNLSDQELEELVQGAQMWEPGARNDEKNKSKGFLGDLLNLLGAVGGGAHIEKNEFGET